MRPYRREKMTSTIRAFLSDAIRDHVNDPRVAPLTTITRVELSADLLSAKVFVTVHGAPPVMRRSLAGLQNAGGHLQRLLAAHLQVRQCPHITFELDEAFLAAQETLRLIESNRTGPPDEPDTIGEDDPASDHDEGDISSAPEEGLDLGVGSDS